MRVLKSAALLLGLLVAGSSIRYSVASIEHRHQLHVGRVAMPGPVPQCPQRYCPPPQLQGQ